MRKIFHPGIFLDTDKERVYVIEIPVLPGKTFAEVMFMGDLHIGHKDFAPRFLAKYLSFLQKTPERRAVLMGDYFEHEEGTPYIKEQIMDFKQQVAEFINFFKPVSKQIVAMVYGNHDERYCKATAQGVDLLDYLRLKIGNPDIAIAPPQRGLVLVFLVKKSFGEGYFAYPIYILHSSTASIVNLETQFRRTADNFDVGLIAHGHSIPGHRVIIVRNSKKEVKILPIEEFEKIFNQDTWETPTLDKKNNCVVWRKVYNCWSTETTEPTYLIRTHCGEIEATGRHSVYIHKSGKNILTNVEEIKEGDLLVHLKTIPMKGTNYTCPEDLAWLLGLYTAEGSSSKYSISIANKNLRIVKKAAKILLRYFKDSTVDYFRRKDECYQINVSSSSVAIYFKENCGEGARKKKIPSFILNAPDNVVKAFLKGYLEGDGERLKHSWRMKTISVELASELMFLLHRIKSEKNKTSLYYDKKKKAYVIGWTGKLCTKFGSKEFKNYYVSPVVSIEKKYYRKVYDLEVEKDERFLDCLGMTLLHNTHKIFWKENTKFIVMEDESGEYRRAVVRQYWLSTGSFLRFPSYGETKSYPIPDMGAPIVRFYASRHALEYVDPRTTYGLDQEPFAETYAAPQAHTEELDLEIKAQAVPQEIDTEIKGLTCPECGSYRVGSKGTEWICKVCGKRWVKNPRRK